MAVADDSLPRPALLAQRLFQSDALNAPISAAELSALNHGQLVRLALELRGRIELLDEELRQMGYRGKGAMGGLHLQVHLAMVELRHFLLFLEERVLRHRLRLRRAGQAPESARAAPCSGAGSVA